MRHSTTAHVLCKFPFCKPCLHQVDHNEAQCQAFQRSGPPRLRHGMLPVGKPPTPGRSSRLGVVVSRPSRYNLAKCRAHGSSSFPELCKILSTLTTRARGRKTLSRFVGPVAESTQIPSRGSGPFLPKFETLLELPLPAGCGSETQAGLYELRVTRRMYCRPLSREASAASADSGSDPKISFASCPITFCNLVKPTQGAPNGTFHPRPG